MRYASGSHPTNRTLQATCLMLTASLIMSAATAAKIKPVVRGKPTFTVSLDVSTLSVKDSDTITFLFLLRAQNHGTWFIHVPIEGGLGGDFFLSIREHGSFKEVEPVVWHHVQQPFTAPVLALSPPGTILGGESEDTAKNFGMRAGRTYDVTAIYRSRMQAEVWHHIPVLSSSDGEFRSNSVQVQVRP